jgi:hypothetical protein
MIFIKTPTVEYELPTNLPPNTAPGDEMTLWVNENNVVLDHYRAGEISHRRFVTGPVRYADTTRAHILWTYGPMTAVVPYLNHNVVSHGTP